MVQNVTFAAFRHFCPFCSILPLWSIPGCLAAGLGRVDHPREEESSGRTTLAGGETGVKDDSKPVCTRGSDIPDKSDKSAEFHLYSRARSDSSTFKVLPLRSTSRLIKLVLDRCTPDRCPKCTCALVDHPRRFLEEQ